MKTTLNLDDRLLREAKKRAADEGTTLTRFVEGAIREALEEAPPAEPYVFDWPSFHGGAFIVDPADRDAVYDLLDGTE